MQPAPAFRDRLRVPSQTNSALLANTLALDKLNEHDGVEVRNRAPRSLGSKRLRRRNRAFPRLLPSGAPCGWTPEAARGVA